jgi:hypothetical protein
MHPGRAAVAGVVCVVVLVTGATATPLWDVPEPNSDRSPLGQGTASVSVVSTPEELTIEPGRQGGGTYYLRVPDATVDVTEREGNPLLTYKIDVEGLGVARSSVHGVADLGTGEKRLSIDRLSLYEDELDSDSYVAEVSLVLRGNGQERILYSEEISIEVQR